MASCLAPAQTVNKGPYRGLFSATIFTLSCFLVGYFVVESGPQVLLALSTGGATGLSRRTRVQQAPSGRVTALLAKFHANESTIPIQYSVLTQRHIKHGYAALGRQTCCGAAHRHLTPNCPKERWFRFG